MRLTQLLVGGFLALLLISCAYNYVPDKEDYFSRCAEKQTWRELKRTMTRNGGSVEYDDIPEPFTYRVVSKQGCAWYVEVDGEDVVSARMENPDNPCFYPQNVLDILSRCAK